MRSYQRLLDHLPIGKLDRLVIIQTVTDSVDAIGTPIETYSGVTERWAYREFLSGRELYEAQQVNSEITTQFIVRYDASIKPKQRLLDASVSPSIAYDIHHAAEMKTSSGRYRLTEILASARNE